MAYAIGTSVGAITLYLIILVINDFYYLIKPIALVVHDLAQWMAELQTVTGLNPCILQNMYYVYMYMMLKVTVSR